jgi:FMN hydrolase / 5-amino-6-(5-phospho-D-ribitylamino)uracil phosphatase
VVAALAPDREPPEDPAAGIRVVAFDLMDTVLHDPFREALEAATGLSLAELFARRDPTVYPAFERGELDEAAYWAHYAAAGIEVDPDVFHRIRRERTTFVPGMAELLDDLAGVVVRAAASNYPVWVEELTEQHLLDRFERVIASHHLGVRKPEPAFFARLVAALDVAPAEVLFVDDREDNVAGADRAGLRAHRFVDASTLRRWLADHEVPIRP